MTGAGYGTPPGSEYGTPLFRSGTRGELRCAEEEPRPPTPAPVPKRTPERRSETPRVTIPDLTRLRHLLVMRTYLGIDTTKCFRSLYEVSKDPFGD